MLQYSHLFYQFFYHFYHKGGESLSIANAVIYEKFKDENFHNLFPDDFSKYDIKYIFLQKDINYAVFYYNNNYSNVESYIENHFNKFLENDNYVIYETFAGSRSVISSLKTRYQKINPTKYKLYLKDLKYQQNLSFFQSFHNNWKLYLKPSPINFWCNPIEYYENTKTTECEHTQKFFEGEELFYLYKKPIFDSSHYLAHEYANGWTIDPEYIKQNFSKEYYKENPDGSIDIELVLYFKPQSYFYLGLIISGTTMLGCFGYLIYDWRKRKIVKLIKNNDKENS